MSMITRTVAFLYLIAVFPSAFAIDEENSCGGYSVFFGNGVANNKAQMLQSFLVLQNNLDPLLKDTEFEDAVTYALAENETFGLFYDLIEVLIQFDQSLSLIHI